MSTDLLLTVPIPSIVLRDSPLIPDLGLGYLAAAALRGGHAVRVIDWNPRLTPEQYRRRLRQVRPRAVGIKVFTVNFLAVRQTMAMIREELPDATLIIGGPHPSMAPAEFLFEEFPDTDLALRGEAETALPQLLEQLREVGYQRWRIDEVMGSFSEIKGLVWRQDGQVRANPSAFEDIRSIGLPAWDLIDPNQSCHFPIDPAAGRRNAHVAPLVATRGCPFECSFCAAHHINSRRDRRREVGEFVDEIGFLSGRYGTTQFVITDSSFLIDHRWVRQVCEEIMKRNLDIRWECHYEVQGRIDLDGMDRLLKLMWRAGCRKLGFSPETVAPHVIERVKKNYDPQALRGMHRLARQHGMDTMGFFMIGLPGETAPDVDLTIRYGLSEPYDKRFFSVLIPLPGTEIYEDLRREHGFERIDWEHFRFEKPPYQVGEVPIPVLFRKLYKANLLSHLKEAPGWRKLGSPFPWGLAARYAYRRLRNW